MLLLLHTFLLQALVLMLRIGTSYQAISLGFDALWIGIIGGAFGLLPAVLGLHLGGFVDRLGETVSFITGGIFIVAASLALLLAGSDTTMLVTASALLGLGQFVCVAAEHNAVARSFADRERDVSFGRLTVAISLAHAVGPMIVGLYGRNALVPDTSSIFMTGVVVSVLLLIIGAVTRPPGHHYEPSGHSAWTTLRTLLGTSGFILSAMAGLVIFAAMDLLTIYLPLYGAERGIDVGTISTLLTLRALASMLSRLMFGRLLQHMGRGGLLVSAMVLAGASIGLVPASDIPIVLAVLIFMAGLGLGIGAPLTLSWISEIAPSRMRASALSLRLALNRVGQASLPVVVGTAAAGLGAAGVLFTTGGALLVAATVSARHFRLFFR